MWSPSITVLDMVVMDVVAYSISVVRYWSIGDSIVVKNHELRTIFAGGHQYAADAHVRQYMGRSQMGLYECKACGSLQRSHSNLRVHVESKHYSPGYPCDHCGRVFKICNSLKKHLKEKRCVPAAANHSSGI